MPTRHLLVIHLHTEKSSQSATCSSESHWKRKHSQSVSSTTGICHRADPSNTIACTGAKSLHLTPCIVKSDSGVRATNMRRCSWSEERPSARRCARSPAVQPLGSCSMRTAAAPADWPERPSDTTTNTGAADARTVEGGCGARCFLPARNTTSFKPFQITTQ